MKIIATSLALGALALSAASVVTVTDADARGRRVSGQVQTERGTATVQRDTMRTRGERSRSTTATGPNGRSTTATETASRDRAEGTYSRGRDRTYADGSTRSVDVDAQRTGEGAYTASRTVTGRDGETRTQTGDFTRTKTENGANVSGAVQTQNHGAIEVQRDVMRADGTRSVVTTATNEAGATRSATAVRTQTQTGSTYARDTTFADGSTRAIDRTTTRDGEGGAVVDRTVTGRDGETRTQTGVFTSQPLPSPAN